MRGEGGEPLTTELAQPRSALWEGAARFHYAQYLDLGWVDPNPRSVVLEYEPWNDGAVAFHVVRDTSGAIVGTLRTILGDIDTLPVSKTCPDVDSAAFAGEPCVEFASLVVDKRFKGLAAAEALYAAGFAWTVHQRATWMVALVDQWLFGIFVDDYQIPFVQVGPPIDYLGTSPIPVAVRLPVLAQSVSSGNPRFWSVLSSTTDPELAGRLLRGERLTGG